jgi:hypothetical protein
VAQARDAKGRFTKGGGNEFASMAAVVYADTDPFHSALAHAHAAFVSFGASLQSAAGSISSRIGGAFAGLKSLLSSRMAILGGASVVGAIGAGYVKAAMAASDFNEQVNKVATVFGPAARTVMAEADAMARKFGVSKIVYMDAAGQIGLIGKAAGMSQAQAAGLANQFTKLAMDASSFYNVPLEEALAAIRSGLVGETEPLRRFGVLLSDAAMKTEAVKMGIIRAGQEMSEQEKVIVRVSLITKGLTDANGDLAKTSDQTANRLRAAWGRIDNAFISIGQAVSPLTEALLDMAERGLGGLEAYLVENTASWKEWIQGVTTAIEQGSEGTGQWATAVFLLERAWAAVVATFYTFRSGVTGLIGYIVEVATYGLRLFEDMLNALGLTDSHMGDTIEAFAEMAKASRDADAAVAAEKWAEVWRGRKDAVDQATNAIKEHNKEAGKGPNGAPGQPGAKPAAVSPEAAQARKDAEVAKAKEKAEKEAAREKKQLDDRMSGMIGDMQNDVAQEKGGVSDRMRRVFEMKQQGADPVQVDKAARLAAQLDAMDKEKEAREKMANDAEQLREETKGPLDRYKEAVERASGLFAQGAISKEERDKALRLARDQFGEGRDRILEERRQGRGERRPAEYVELADMSRQLQLSALGGNEKHVERTARATEETAQYTSKMAAAVDKLVARLMADNGPRPAVAG